jgi:hypothetical protein
MLRISRPLGTRCLGLFVAGLSAIAATTANASDASLEPQSTLAPRITPHEFTIDATIASMVRRGLLTDVKPTAPERTAAPRLAPAPTPKLAPTTTPNTSSDWRPRGSALSASSLPITPTPKLPAAPSTSTLDWGPVGQSTAPHAGPSLAPPTTAMPDLPVEPAPNLALGEPEPAPAEPAMEAPAIAAPALEAPSLEAPQMPDAAPVRVAARPEESLAEPPTSDDPLPDEHLAPIDDLPETPAPDHDAPGDPREPEIGDEQLEGSLIPPANGPQLPDAPSGPSLSARTLTPAAEPDRIEQPDENVAPPTNTESYQEPEETPAAAPVRPLTRNQLALRDKVRRVLKYYYNNPLNTGNRSPWEVMHCMLSYEVHSRILKGGPQGEPITTVGWLCFNQPCKGRTLMYLNETGDLRVKVGPALQGHHGQLLALLAQARVRTDYPLKVEGKDFTVADLIEVEKATCYPRTELTFKLIGLQRYLDINARWMNDQGMPWDFPTLLREEMRQPVRTAACGGTHRLSGLILTVKKRQRSGLPVDGEYAAAQKFVQNYVNYAYRLQNPDGSFSTEWFKGPGSEPDIDRRLKTTGHQLEFLIYASNDEGLANYRTVRAVNYLSNIMWANRGRDWEAGPLGHAVHALVLYDRLVYAPHDGEQAPTPAPVARQQSPRHPQPRRR